MFHKYPKTFRIFVPPILQTSGIGRDELFDLTPKCYCKDIGEYE